MREHTTRPAVADSSCSRDTGTALASIAAIGSVLAASSCCLPIVPFVVAAGFAGISEFLVMARPYLLAASILFIAYGFYQARRTRVCRRKPSLTSAVLLWVSTVFVFVSIFFPQFMANAMADWLGR
jgi:hypothetical protein